MVGHHARRRPAVGRQVRRQPLGRAHQHRHRPVGRPRQVGVAGDGDAALEHGDVVARVLPRELQVGPPRRHEGRERRRPAVVPGPLQPVGEHHVALPRHLLHQLVAAAEMPVGRRAAHPRRPRRLGQGEAERPPLLDQLQRRRHQRLAQVAVVVGLARLGVSDRPWRRSSLPARAPASGGHAPPPAGGAPRPSGTRASGTSPCRGPRAWCRAGSRAGPGPARRAGPGRGRPSRRRSRRSRNAGSCRPGG